MQARQRGKDGKASKRPGNFTEYPTRQGTRRGLKAIFDLRKAAGQIHEPLAQWCLTPDDRCTFAWENPTSEDVTTGR
ncbi:hypothetical protein AAH145_05360 [Bacteroides thetaiotaomicron]|uniref:hypothetical protein n=1 Tax=Bacteroidaceae TaxID=815 RepID=UPI0039B4E2D7